MSTPAARNLSVGAALPFKAPRPWCVVKSYAGGSGIETIYGPMSPAYAAWLVSEFGDSAVWTYEARELADPGPPATLET